MSDDDFLYGNDRLHQAPSGPLADSEAVYPLQGYFADFMVKASDEACPGCGEFHSNEAEVAVRLLFKDDKTLTTIIDPITAIRLAGDLLRIGTDLAFGTLGTPEFNISDLPQEIRDALGIDENSEEDEDA